MAGIKQPLQDILTQAATLTASNGDGAITNVYVRVWNNQIDRMKKGESYAFPLPALFVEIVSPVAYQEIGGNVLTADLGFNIHIVTQNLDNGGGTFDQDLVVFDLRDALFALFSKFKPTACGEMVIVNEQQDYDHDNVYHYVVSWVCHYLDSKASPYDSAAGKFIDSQYPLALTLNEAKDTQPIMETGTQTFRIPK